MAEPAIRRMTLEEFLRWDDGTDTRYELIDGFPVAMAPPAEAHRILARSARLSDRRGARESGGRAMPRSSLEWCAPIGRTRYYIPDIAVTCEPNRARPTGYGPRPDPDCRDLVPEHRATLIVGLKVPAYRDIESVQEILLDRCR